MINKIIEGYLPQLTAIRHDIHQHPELGFEEFRTSDLVADYLNSWGYEVHRGLAGTGVVGTLQVGDGVKRLGLRADMDALPIEENNGKPWSSSVANRMHACGHDGHTTMLLGAARYLAQTRNFNGTLHLIFQPAEEMLNGGARMVEQGLFERFPATPSSPCTTCRGCRSANSSSSTARLWPRWISSTCGCRGAVATVPFRS